MQVYFVIVMFIIGSVFGSFLCCQARRLHLKSSQKISLGSRSVCPKCKKQLRWFENIPLFSWLFLRGHCRYCKTKIGITEFLSELFGGIIFALVTSMLKFTATGFIFNIPGLFNIETPFALLLFVTMILLVIGLGFLSIYDALYKELPSSMLLFSGITAAVFVGIKIWSLCDLGIFEWTQILNLLGAILILAGTYFILFRVSKGQWVGDGDWLVCLPLALALGDSFLALFVLFFANFLGCIVMLPILKSTQKSKKSPIKNVKIPFGPFLAAGFLIALFLAPILLKLI